MITPQSPLSLFRAGRHFTRPAEAISKDEFETAREREREKRKEVEGGEEDENQLIQQEESGNI